jgi:transcriptional regulator with XRE-family HTH domain
MLTGMPRHRAPSTVFGARLLTLRKTRGLSQTQLGEAIGATQRAISYYEAGGGNPDLDVVAKLARALGVTADELIGTDTPPPTEDTANTPERRIWRRFRQLMALPEKDQRAVLRMLDSMTKAARSEERTTTG